jgi:ribonuclease Z
VRGGKLGALRAKAHLEDVADGVECGARAPSRLRRCGAPVAADHELRKGRGGELVEREVRLPRWTFAHRRASGSECRRLQLDVAWREPERAEKAEAVAARLVRRSLQLGELGDELLGDGVAADEGERRRLDHRQRADGLGTPGRGEQRHDAAVGVSDEMRTGRKECGDVRCVAFEVDAAVRRRAPEPAPVHEQQLEVGGKRTLLRPRLLAPAEAAVHEDGRGTVAPPRDVEVVHGAQTYNRRVDLDVVFLGTSGSMPTAQRAPAAILIRRGGERLLVDCAEGTQRQLLRSTVGLVDLAEIFLTHFHADHVLGLPGMLKTFALRGREVPLAVYGPRGLVDLFASLKRVIGKLTYDVRLVEIAPGDALERDGYTLVAFDVSHGATAIGWSLAERERPGRFDVAAADALGVAPMQRGELQRGVAVTASGRVVAPEEVLGPARPGRKIVITGDTAPTPHVTAAAVDADVLVTEATFLDEERERAAETLHQTALQAAEVARSANVRLLALTHLSSRYFGPEIAREAREVFPETVVPRDFDVIEVPFAERGPPQLIREGARHRRAPDVVSSGAQ